MRLAYLLPLLIAACVNETPPPPTPVVFQPLAVSQGSASFSIRGEGAAPSLVFGQTGTPFHGELLVLRYDGETWDSYHDARSGTGFAWLGVFQSRDLDDIWAFAQFRGVGSEPIVLLASNDAGLTFWTTEIETPGGALKNLGFQIDGHGQGSLRVRMDNHYESEPVDIAERARQLTQSKKIRAGLYVYETSDGGRSWSKPRYESDIIGGSTQVLRYDPAHIDLGDAKNRME